MPFASHAAAGAKRSRPSNVRRHRRPGVAPLRELDDPLRRRLAQHQRQHAVVGRDEAIVARLGRDAAPRRADAGVDDREEDGAGGKYR